MRGTPKPFLDLTAADLMSTPVLTIPQETSLREAARLLCRSSISGAPVVNLEGECVGVLSSSDFVSWAGNGAEAKEVGKSISFIAPWGELIHIDDSPDSEIRHYMTVPPVAVSPGTPIGELTQTMVDAHIHRVLVVESKRPRGIITSTDILAAVAQAAQRGSLKRKAKPEKSRTPG
jgi:CBS domain-containing protein